MKNPSSVELHFLLVLIMRYINDNERNQNSIKTAHNNMLVEFETWIAITSSMKGK